MTSDTPPAGVGLSAWIGSRSHVDHVSVRVRAVESPSDDELPIEEWGISSSVSAWPPDWLIERAQLIVLAAKPATSEYPPDFYIDVRESRMNWGADAAVFEILIGIASWAATSAAWDAVKALANGMNRRIRGDDPTPDTEAIPTEQEAIEAAVEIATSTYTETADQLTIDEVSLAAGHASVTLRSPEGWRYEYELLIAGDDVRATRIRRYRVN